MPKEFKPGFIYIKSEILKQEVALSEKTGWVYCEDGVKYSPQEIDILAEAGAVINLETHKVKKEIGRDIVDIKQAKNETVLNEQRELDIF